jgi:predicted transcriptional regulator
MTEVTTIRIDEETKRKIKRYGIRVSKVARKAILDEIERREHEDAIQALRRMKIILRKVDTNRIVKHIQESRINR